MLIVCRALFAVGLLGVMLGSLLPLNVKVPVENADKVTHFISYFVLFALGAAGFPDRRRRWQLLILLPVFGILLEVGQHFVPGRHAGWLDAAANTAGVLAAAVGMMLWRKASEKA